MTAAFWRDPPWRGGRNRYRMALRPIDRGTWLPEPISADERARKERLLDTAPVCAELDGSRPGQRAAQAAVTRAVRCPAALPRPSSPPLVNAALLVPDDLCLMERDGAAYRLTAAVVCSPSYWQLAEKIGRTLDGIHDPVPTLNDKLGASMAQFFERLPMDAPFERRNWNLHTTATPHHPQPDCWRDAPDDPTRLVMRSERQTLLRLDAERVLFTIRVTTHPLGEIVEHPEAARDLLAALDAMDAAERAATGYRYYAPAVIEFLRSIPEVSR